MDEEKKVNQETKLCKHCQSEIPKKAKVCPVCRKKQPNKVGAIVGGVIVLLIIIGAIGGGNDSSSSNKTTNETPKVEETAEPIEYLKVSVEQLESDLRNNALSASDTYKNQYVEVTGYLSNIDASGQYIDINAGSSDFSFIMVQCYLRSDEQRDVVSKLNVYDPITVRGKCFEVGEVMGYSIRIEEIIPG